MENSKITTYLLGGVPRSGKHFVANYLLEKYQVPGITSDLLREAFSIGVPEFGIRSDDWNQSDEERSHILWPYFKGLIIAREEYEDRLLIEGTNFLPELLADVKDINYLRACFLGFPNIDPREKFELVRKYEVDGNDWTRELPDEKLMDLVKHFIKLSRELEQECEKYGFRFFDISSSFDETIVKVGDYLVNGN